MVGTQLQATIVTPGLIRLPFLLGECVPPFRADDDAPRRCGRSGVDFRQNVVE